MTDKEAMAMALDALETEVSIDWTNNDEFNASAEKMHEAITALKERLAQPEQEPVAWMDADGNVSDNNDNKCFPIPLYAHPPQRTEPAQRTWVGLTGEDVAKAYDDYQSGRFSAGFMGAIRSIEAKLKEKNA